MFCCSNRKKIIFIGIGLSLLISLTACETKREPFTFYPIDSLVSAQVMTLTAMKAQLQKQAVLGKTEDTITYSPKDSLAWLEELEIFSQLQAINKPANRGSYLVDDSLYDPGSNLTVKAFTSKV